MNANFDLNQRSNTSRIWYVNTDSGGAGQAGLEPADSVHPYQWGEAQGGGQEAQT